MKIFGSTSGEGTGGAHTTTLTPENIWSRKDLFDILREEGISPSINVSHAQQDIIAAIQNHN